MKVNLAVLEMLMLVSPCCSTTLVYVTHEWLTLTIQQRRAVKQNAQE